MDQYNYVAEVAACFGKKPEEPFKVIGAGNIAVVRFSLFHGMDRFDGSSWNAADYFLGPLMTGRVRMVETVEQGSLFQGE